MRMKMTTTMNKITKFSLEEKKGTGHDTHKPERISLSISALRSSLEVFLCFSLH